MSGSNSTDANNEKAIFQASVENVDDNGPAQASGASASVGTSSSSSSSSSSSASGSSVPIGGSNMKSSKPGLLYTDDGHPFENFGYGDALTPRKDSDEKKGKPTPGVPLAAIPKGTVYELTNEEDIKIASALTGEAKDRFVAAVRDINELNGTGDIPGVQASYIEKREHVQDFRGVNVSKGMNKALYLAYNWQALGKGVGGLAGAAVRWNLRDQFVETREMNVHRVVPAGAANLIAEYEKTATLHKELVNFFMTNAISIAGLAGAMFNRITHHWDAQHTGPQKAFIGAMGMQDHLSEDQFRPVFYLAIHPLPLRFTEAVRSDVVAGKRDDVAEVVALRCNGPPAGYGAVNACAAAVPSFLSEKILHSETYAHVAYPVPPDEGEDTDAYDLAYAKADKQNRINESRRAGIPVLVARIQAVANANAQLIANASYYHQFAVKYGHTRRHVYDQKVMEQAMILLTAYIYAKVKGSLANSAALKKFRDQHSRQVQKAIAAFATLDEGENIFEILGL